MRTLFLSHLICRFSNLQLFLCGHLNASNMEGPDGSTSNVEDFGTSNSNAENRTAALNKLKLIIERIIALTPVVLLEPATKNVVKSSLDIINNLLSDQGNDDIAALLKGFGDSFDELINALAEIDSMSDKAILEHFYGDKINSLRESLNKRQATISDLETAKTNAEESLNTCQGGINKMLSQIQSLDQEIGGRDRMLYDLTKSVGSAANRLHEKEEQLKMDSRDESECQKLRSAMLESLKEKIRFEVENMLKFFS